ncbi:hypothetical protein H4219_003162 [Mycoemilia scoparia]|uniref:Uncharacterized protein n=1 Tax=Mycoemilia scoparia TaxID=417184 RepID=A0A9W8DTT0_9FUNG|nr:hypothetical protein H4219_003162 [Mycoemilia scoparia]
MDSPFAEKTPTAKKAGKNADNVKPDIVLAPMQPLRTRYTSQERCVTVQYFFDNTFGGSRLINKELLVKHLGKNNKSKVLHRISNLKERHQRFVSKELLGDERRYFGILLKIVSPHLPEGHPRKIPDCTDPDPKDKDLIIEVCYREVLGMGFVKSDWHIISQVAALKERLVQLRAKFQEWINTSFGPNLFVLRDPLRPTYAPKGTAALLHKDSTVQQRLHFGNEIHNPYQKPLFDMNIAFNNANSDGLSHFYNDSQPYLSFENIAQSNATTASTFPQWNAPDTHGCYSTGLALPFSSAPQSGPTNLTEEDKETHQQKDTSFYLSNYQVENQTHVDHITDDAGSWYTMASNASYAESINDSSLFGAMACNDPDPNAIIPYVDMSLVKKLSTDYSAEAGQHMDPSTNLLSLVDANVFGSSGCTK